MANRTKFAGIVRAVEYFYGGTLPGGQAPPGLTVSSPAVPSGVQTLLLETGLMVLTDGTIFAPLAINAPVLVGGGSNQETVTPSSVISNGSQIYNTAGITATFANTHGTGDPVASGTCGLQEAINFVSGQVGGGIVAVDYEWYAAGGTLALITAASLPSAGGVRIWDTTTGQFYGNTSGSLTVLAAPSAATSATVASQAGIVGTWTAVTEHVLFTYVNANGGETLASADYSFTATVSLAIGGSGPAALAGAVGYRVYIGTNATTACYMVPVTAANGTVIQCGPIAAFKIGTPFSVAAVTTSAQPNPPLVSSTAFGAAVTGPASGSNSVYGPFAVTGVVTAGTAIEWGKFTLPTGFLNVLNRTLLIKLYGYYTPVSTATLIITVAIASVYGVTSTTVFTVTTPASSGTTAANINGEIVICTSAVGATGTVECHGTLLYGGATGTAGLLVAAGDSVQAVSSAVDLTKQDTVVISINSGTANLTQSQLRRMIVEVLQ